MFLLIEQGVLWGWKNVILYLMEIFPDFKKGFAFCSSDPTSGNISKGTQNTNSKEHKHPYVHCSITYNQDPEAAQVAISRWVDKTTMGHLYSAIKKEESFALCSSMDGYGEQHAKWNKPVRERQIAYDFTHMWDLMNKLN